MSLTAVPRLPVPGWATLRGAHGEEVPSLLQRRHRVFTSSGRTAIALALRSLGVSPGDRVLVPTYHCPSMIAPLAALGVVPLFYPLDVDGRARPVALDQLELSGVRAILAAHYFGASYAMDELADWCRARGIQLVEDCAHALFGSMGGQPVGSWGDAVIASLPKFLPTLTGGLLILREGTQLPRLKRLSRGARLRYAIDLADTAAKYGRLTGLNGGVRVGLQAVRMLRSLAGSVLHAPSSSTYAPSEADQAVLAPTSDPDFSIDLEDAGRSPSPLCVRLARQSRRSRIVSTRHEHYASLAAALSALPGVRPLRPVLSAGAVPYVFPLWADAPESLYARLRRRGVPVTRWERLWPGTPSIVGDYGLLWAHHVIQIGCHQDISSDELRWMISELREAVGAANPQLSQTRSNA